MAKTLLLQHKEALAERDALFARADALQASLDALTASSAKQAGELTEALATISDLTGKLDAAQTRDVELCQELATAQNQLTELAEAAKTPTKTSASQEAQVILADIGVPPVAADSAEQPRIATLDDLQAQYAGLLKTDTRAAGVFYNDKLAPALRK